ncbi:MAG: tRNA 5-methoxyuridine(34)/uridine 5-oxyacetic acid(34) synthase CmoB, partial [Bdellovibrionota bacterium]|nr:tRNA 5-methoxyuridine(34)/uridine 5-oxyacetic acid(34) synthase CmoB [Bdellovibrionota bacterium]
WKSQTNSQKYKSLLENLKNIKFIKKSESNDYFSGVDIESDQSDEIEKIARSLIPWRKGPFKIGNLTIDAEWRSDQKWKRIEEYLPDLSGKTILDIGANNGYYMFQMAKQNPRLVLGIDPVLHCKAQFEFINHFVEEDNLKFELLGVDDVPLFRSLFDVIFSMGILYHHRHPIAQLIDIREALKSEGTAIIETIGIPGEESICLFPEDKYSKMRNVWFLPTLSCLKNWVLRAGFTDIEVISVSKTDFSEQRLTDWCPPPHQSLKDFLKEGDDTKTVEGYPAPMRFCLKAKKKKSPIKKFD